MINTDKPIECINEDKLGRKDFVKRVSKAIYDFKSTDNIAIAVQGKWGCGKTSILNMICNEISEKSEDILVVKFNPWNFTDCNQLINQFFVNLSTELKEHFETKTEKKEKRKEIMAEIGRVMDKYSYALEYSKYIPVVGKYLEIIPQLVSSVGSALSEDDDSKRKDIAYQKKQLINSLKELESRIVIIIDDIDRLPNEQIRLIFQLVCSVADFPNVTYLLSYDKDVVVKALSDVQNENGEKYLEKIIQLSFDVPYIKTSMIYDLLIDKIKETIVLPEEELDSEYWHMIFKSCIVPFVNSVRNINRFVNLLSFSYVSVKDEVCFSDMAALTAIQLFASSIYEWIRNNKYTLVGCCEGGRLKADDVKENKKKYIDIFGTKYLGNIETVITALSTMFPNFSNKVSCYYQSITSLELRKNKRIASIERFDVYFSLSLDDVKISDSEFLKSLKEMNEEQLQDYLSSIKSQNLLNDYKNELKMYSDDISENRIELLLSKLMFSSGRIENNQKLVGYEEKNLDVYFIIDLLKLVKNEDYRYQIIKKLMINSDFESFQNLLHLSHIIELNYGKIANTEYKTQEKLISEEHFKDMEETILRRIKEYSNTYNIFCSKECMRTLLLWEVIDQESFSDYVKEKIKEPIITLKLVSLAISEWSSTNGIVEYELKEMEYYNYKRFVNDDVVINYIEQERVKNDFWKLDANTIKKIIAFYIIKKESESRLIDAEIVDKRYNEWQYDNLN